MRLKFIVIIFFVFQFVNGIAQEVSFLPKPSGPFYVGTTEIFVADSSRKETLPLINKPARQLYLKIWYPADCFEGKDAQHYLNNYSAKTIYSIFKPKGISKQDAFSMKSYTTNSFEDITVSFSQNQFPVIFFNPGFYFGMVDLYTNFMEELASNGFIVISITHPYQQPLIPLGDGSHAKLQKKKTQLTFLEYALKERYKVEDLQDVDVLRYKTERILKKLHRFNQTVDLWVQDNQFVADYLQELNIDTAKQFYGRLDITNIGVFGQSVGGAVAGQLCLVDPRFKAGVNIDCFQLSDVFGKDLHKPFLNIESEYKQKWILANSVIYENTTADFYNILFKNTTHFIGSDAPLMPIVKDKKEDFYGSVDGPQTINIMNKYILSFFNLYLKNISSEILTKELETPDVLFKIKGQ